MAAMGDRVEDHEATASGSLTLTPSITASSNAYTVFKVVYASCTSAQSRRHTVRTTPAIRTGDEYGGQCDSHGRRGVD